MKNLKCAFCGVSIPRPEAGYLLYSFELICQECFIYTPDHVLNRINENFKIKINQLPGYLEQKTEDFFPDKIYNEKDFMNSL